MRSIARGAVLLALAWSTVMAGRAPSAAQEAGGQNPQEGLERALFDSVNAYRASVDLRPDTWSEEIAALARAHSRAMASGKIPFGHDGFQDRLATLRATLAVKSAAENISKQARDLSEVVGSTMSGWLTSAVHTKNIEREHDLSGVGAARAEDGTFYLTQIFVKTQPAQGR